jgi:peptide/nickel transport system permease protein
MSIPGYILAEAGLSLVGLGIQDPVPSWGNMLSESLGIVQIQFAPWIMVPGIFIFVTAICFNLVGDVLRDSFDPMMKDT